MLLVKLHSGNLNCIKQRISIFLSLILLIRSNAILGHSDLFKELGAFSRILNADQIGKRNGPNIAEVYRFLIYYFD